MVSRGDRQVKGGAVHLERSREGLCREDRNHGADDRGLEAVKQTTRNQIHRLNEKNDELSNRVQDLTLIAQGAKKAVHDAKVDLAASYSQLLSVIKEKWVAEKEFTVLESQADEVESNLTLIDQIAKTVVDLTVERPRLQAELDDLEVRCATKEVSDFTLSKLDIPQVSEMSVVRPMDVNEQGTLIGLDEFGSNKDAFPGGLGEDPSTVFATPVGVEGVIAYAPHFKFLCFRFGLSA